MHQLQTFAVGVTAYAMVLVSLGTVWEWPCVIVGSLLGGWSAGEFWCGRQA